MGKSKLKLISAKAEAEAWLSLAKRKTGIVGYNTKVVEKAGQKLRKIVPNTNPWKGQPCERSNCQTCQHEEESKQDCRKRNLVYESICELCNPTRDGMKKKKEKGEMLEDKRPATSIYVGESCRSIAERSLEHVQDQTGLRKSPI